MTDEEVADLLPHVLDRIEWKRAGQITYDLNKKAKEATPGDKVHITLAQVFLTLEKAVDDKWIESRASGKITEFRLIGIGRRIKQGSTSKEGLGWLTPKTI